MIQTECLECGAKISEKAEGCDKCGTAKLTRVHVILFVALFGLAWLIAYIVR